MKGVNKRSLPLNLSVYKTKGPARIQGLFVCTAHERAPNKDHHIEFPCHVQHDCQPRKGASSGFQCSQCTQHNCLHLISYSTCSDSSRLSPTRPIMHARTIQRSADKLICTPASVTKASTLAITRLLQGSAYGIICRNLARCICMNAKNKTTWHASFEPLDDNVCVRLAVPSDGPGHPVFVQDVEYCLSGSTTGIYAVIVAVSPFEL